MDFFQDLWCKKTTVPGLSYGVVCMVIMFSHFDSTPSCDRQTDRQMDTIALHGNKPVHLPTSHVFSSNSLLPTFDT